MSFTVGTTTFAQDGPFALISGPCQLESLDHARLQDERVTGLCDAHGIGYVF